MTKRRINICRNDLNGCLRTFIACRNALNGCLRDFNGCLKALNGSQRTFIACRNALNGCLRVFNGCLRALNGCLRYLTGYIKDFDRNPIILIEDINALKYKSEQNFHLIFVKNIFVLI